MMLEKVSAPMTMTLRYRPEAMNWQPVVNAKRAPEQTAAMSNPAALVAPSFSWTMHAEAGAGRSGVAVASTMRSNSEAAMPAMSRAR